MPILSPKKTIFWGHKLKKHILLSFNSDKLSNNLENVSIIAKTNNLIVLKLNKNVLKSVKTAFL